MHAVLVVALAFVAVSLPQEPDPAAPEVLVVGRVVDRETREPLVGARVDALFEGAFPYSRGTTDERGEFELELPAGVYDVRAVARGGLHRAAFARELDLVTQPSAELLLEVDTIASALQGLGVDPEGLVDLDGDLVPDPLERGAGFDPEVTDRNEAGVRAGVAAWVGADPVRAPLRTDRAPHWLLPADGSPHPIAPGLPAPPIGLLFGAVPGATGYLLDLLDDTGDRVQRTELEFTRDKLLIGEGVVAAWTPPSAVHGGLYRLRLQAYHHHAADTLGLPAERTLEFVEFDAEDLAELEVVAGEELEWSGLVVARSIALREGAVVRVPAGEVLQLVSFGNVLIERGARIRGEDGRPREPDAPPVPPADLRIACRGSLQLLGELRAGSGFESPPVEVSSAEDSAVVARADRGGAGAALDVFAFDAIHVARRAQLASGTGGDGGGAGARSLAVGGDAVAYGGDGGPGGRLILWGNLHLADRRGVVAVGEGGSGGGAVAYGGAGSGSIAAGLGTALPGVGGDAGDVWLSRWDLRRDGFAYVDDPDFPVVGGRAGSAGDGEVTHGSPGPSSRGRRHEPPAGRAGGRGWRLGGAGQTLVAQGGPGGAGQRGGEAHAQGGAGGPLVRIGLRASELESLFGFTPRGGDGGLAVAHGGSPGARLGDRAGDAGGATALGGLGGPGYRFPSPVPSEGGRGGDARAVGPDGLQGASHCSPPQPGGKGSQGGDAHAVGGRGGDAFYFAGTPGSGDATGGAGGAGGDGKPAGAGGFGGNASAGTDGEGRGSLPAVGVPGERRQRGARGPHGADCPR